MDDSHRLDQTLERIFNELMIGEQTPVRERTRLNSLRWDSLMQLNLITAIEQEFQITCADEDVIEMNSFRMARQLVRERLADRQAIHG